MPLGVVTFERAAASAAPERHDARAARLVGRGAGRGSSPVLLAISLLVFSIVHVIPGDPAVIAAGLEASPATVERIRRDLGLDQPLPVQFASFVTRAVARRPRPVDPHRRAGRARRSSIGCRTPRSSPPAACRWRVGLGLVDRAGRGAVAPRARRSPAHGGQPASRRRRRRYWLALMLMLRLLGGARLAAGDRRRHAGALRAAVRGAGPAVGRRGRPHDAGLGARRPGAGLPARRAGQGRAGTAACCSATACATRCCRCSAWSGLRVGGLLAGTVLVESVFAVPGVGRMMVDAVVARDFPMVQGGVLVVATMVVVVNALTDLVGRMARPAGAGVNAPAGASSGATCWPPAPSWCWSSAVVAAAVGAVARALRSARRRPGVELPAELVGASARHRPPRPRHAEPAGGRRPGVARHRPGRHRGRAC